MTKKLPTKKKPKITEAERHKRFVETAREIGASEEPKDFDKAFKRITQPKSRRPRSG